MSKVIEITNFTEYDEFKRNHRRGVIFYSAQWCQACQEIKDLYYRIAKRYYKRVALAYVDIDVAKLDFTAVPVFVAFRKGKQINNMEGADRNGLKQLIKETIQAK